MTWDRRRGLVAVMLWLAACATSSENEPANTPSGQGPGIPTSPVVPSPGLIAKDGRGNVPTTRGADFPSSKDSPRICAVVSDSPFEPKYHPALRSPESCSKETFAEFKKNCLPFSKRCSKWLKASPKNRTCFKCTGLASPEFNEHWGFEVRVGASGIVLRNNAFSACLEVLGDSKEATECAAQFQAARSCAGDACYTCLREKSSQVQPQDARTGNKGLDACLKTARKTVCSSFAEAESCAKAFLDDPTSKAAACKRYLDAELKKFPDDDSEAEEEVVPSEKATPEEPTDEEDDSEPEVDEETKKQAELDGLVLEKMCSSP